MTNSDSKLKLFKLVTRNLLTMAIDKPGNLLAMTIDDNQEMSVAMIKSVYAIYSLCHN